MATTNDFMATTGYIPKAWNAKRSSLITRELRNSKVDVEAEYARLIGEGYEIYDIPAEGGLTYLSGKAAGKWLACWKSFEPTYLDTPVTGNCPATGHDSTHIQLATGDGADVEQGMVVELTAGTGSGQFNIVKSKSGDLIEVYKTWGTIPDDTTDYKVGGADSIVAGDVTIHDDVVVMGIKIDVWSQITKFDLQLNVYFLGGDEDFTNKLTLYFLNLKVAGASYSYHYGIKFSNNSIDFHGTQVNFFERCNCYNNTITISRLTHLGSNCELINNIITGGPQNSYIYFDNLKLKNLYLDDVSIFFSGSFSPTEPISNVCVIESHIYNQLGSASFLLFVRDVTFSNYAIGGLILKPAYPDRQTFISDEVTEWTLDIDGVMTDGNFAKFDTMISTNLKNFRVAGNEYSRRYYQFSFLDNHEIPDKFKTMFAREQSVLVIHRDDLDEVLVNAAGGAKKIKNLQLYENNGTTPFDYRNNENFLMVIEGADAVKRVVCWYEGMVFPSAFSDFWDNTEYTILRCFQLLEPPEDVVWRNRSIGQNYKENCPVEGSMSFQDMTSIFVDKR